MNRTDRRHWLALALGGTAGLAGLPDARLDGAGTLQIDADQVEVQRVVIGGACSYNATRLQSREAELSIDGRGEMRVTVAERLLARIGGSGQVRYRGRPQVQGQVTGAGVVRRDDGG